jgi:hypothetical protein
MDNDISKEVKEQLEIDRSKVRRRLTYGAGIIGGILILWGSLWMADRTVMILGINTAVALMFYWFGQRGAKPPEIK